MHLVVLVNSQKIFVRMKGRILSSTRKVVRPQLWYAYVCLGAWVVYPLAVLLSVWAEDGSSSVCGRRTSELTLLS